MVMRIDQYLVQHHGFTRNKAQQLIESCLVSIDAKICKKASYDVWKNPIVTILPDRRVDWVSRSAEKLIGFIETLQNPIDILWTHCLDIGSSTGWFTQVLLLLWADHIDAVDVGTDQLNTSLRENIKVTSFEKMDIRDFAKQNIWKKYDIIVCDASFISLCEIIDSIGMVADSNTRIILLYKPQFEVWRENLRKTGIPKDSKIVEQKMREFDNFLASKNIEILVREKSTLVGEAGNQEWVYMVKKSFE